MKSIVPGLRFAVHSLTPEPGSDWVWSSALSMLPPAQRDIFQEPQYMGLWNDPAYLAHIGDNNGRFLALPFLMDASRRIYNPYGFGGPAGDMELWPDLLRQLGYWGARRHMFVLNPFDAADQRRALPDAQYIKDVVYVDLAKHGSDWMRDGHRYSIKRAEREGAEVVEFTAEHGAAVDEFSRIYAAAMERLDAAPKWRFGAHFWQRLPQLGRRALIYLVSLGGNVEAGALILYGHGRAYYHLAATHARHPRSGLNHLMVLRSIQAARARGLAVFHLGGGLTPASDDPLFRFKAGFSHLRAPVWVADSDIPERQRAEIAA